MRYVQSSPEPVPCRPETGTGSPSVIEAVKEVGLEVPLVVRLEGTRVTEGKAILNASGLNVISADDLDDAAQKIVNAIRRKN